VKNYQVYSFFLSNHSIFIFKGINATPVDNDMRVWNALIDGPVDTCYEDGLFTLRLEFAGIISKNSFFLTIMIYYRYLSINTT
jgi:hypothetical protein